VKIISISNKMNVSLQGFSIYTTRVSPFQGKELFTLRIRNLKERSDSNERESGREERERIEEICIKRGNQASSPTRNLHTSNQRERELSSLCTPQARERKEEHGGFEIPGGEV
jgi:hypothetical protein